MDDIEALVRAARPASGCRDRELSERAERELDALVAPPHLGRTPRRALRRRASRPWTKRIGALVLVSVIALAGAAGLASILDGTHQGARHIAQPVEPDPSAVLSAAAERLGEEAAQGEAGIVVPDVSESEALVAWLTSGAASRGEQAAWLRALADGGAATRAERGSDETWRVRVGEVILVIRADTGEITEIVHDDGAAHHVPPAM